MTGRAVPRLSSTASEMVVDTTFSIWRRRPGGARGGSGWGCSSLVGWLVVAGRRPHPTKRRRPRRGSPSSRPEGGESDRRGEERGEPAPGTPATSLDRRNPPPPPPPATVHAAPSLGGAMFRPAVNHESGKGSGGEQRGRGGEKVTSVLSAPRLRHPHPPRPPPHTKPKTNAAWPRTLDHTSWRQRRSGRPQRREEATTPSCRPPPPRSPTLLPADHVGGGAGGTPPFPPPAGRETRAWPAVARWGHERA